MKDPAAKIEFAAPDLRFGAYELGRIGMTAVVARKEATVAATADRFGVNADAVIGVESPYPATVKMQVNDLNLEALPMELQTPLEGRLRASMEGTGDLANPERGRATATIDAFAGTWKGHASASTRRPARLRGRTTGDRAASRRGAGLVGARQRRAAIDRSRRHGALTVDGARTSLRSRSTRRRNRRNRLRRTDLTGIVRGTLKAIDPDLVLTVENGSIVTPDIQPGLSEHQPARAGRERRGQHRAA